MPASLHAVTLEESRAAQVNVASACLRTPLVRLNWKAPAGHPGEGVEIFLKLENLQPIASFKLRGAGNACANLKAKPSEVKKRGVVTASAGNMAQGLAANAQRIGCPCTAVVPDHAPSGKVEAIERLGCRVIAVPFDEWWTVLMTGNCPQAPDGFFVHPVLDQDVLAGNSTIGLEILEDLPDPDAVVVPYGGGALACGIASVVKEMKPGCRVLACEPETAAPLAKSFEVGKPSAVDYRPTFVDGCGGKSVFEPIWPLAKKVLDGSLAVPIKDIVTAIKT